MAIIKAYPADMSARELYDLTNSPKLERMADHYGETIGVAAYAIAEEIDKDGLPQTKVAVKTTDGRIMASNSAPFLRDFNNILGCLERAKLDPIPAHISIDQRPTKNGKRMFSGCTWID